MHRRCNDGRRGLGGAKPPASRYWSSERTSSDIRGNARPNLKSYGLMGALGWLSRRPAGRGFVREPSAGLPHGWLQDAARSHAWALPAPMGAGQFCRAGFRGLFCPAQASSARMAAFKGFAGDVQPRLVKFTEAQPGPRHSGTTFTYRPGGPPNPRGGDLPAYHARAGRADGGYFQGRTGGGGLCGWVPVAGEAITPSMPLISPTCGEAGHTPTRVSVHALSFVLRGCSSNYYPHIFTL